MQRALDEIAKERTVVMIAHRLKTVRGAEQILVLEDGKIIEQGTHDQLVGENGLYARLWDYRIKLEPIHFSQLRRKQSETV